MSMYSPNTSWVLRSSKEIGVPVNAMKRRVRQGVAEVPGVAVEVVVVAAVRLVDDHDDVAPVGQQRVVGAGVASPSLVRPNFCRVVK